MAIPIYVPDEYGPVPVSTPTPSAVQARATPSNLNQPGSCASFVHQLIVELCSIYQECCAASGDRSSDTGLTGPSRDVNNNSTSTTVDSLAIPRPTRRRRHPAGDHEPGGLRPHNHDMVPLPALMASAPNDFQPSTADGYHQHDRTEFECKLSMETNFGSIGFQLRQIADSYAMKATESRSNSKYAHHENRNNPKIGSSSNSISPDRTFWQGTFAFVGSLLFLSVSVTATVVLIKNK